MCKPASHQPDISIITLLLTDLRYDTMYSMKRFSSEVTPGLSIWRRPLHSGLENWKILQWTMWNWYYTDLPFCSIFDNLVYCAMLSEPRVGFSFHFFGWGHEGGGSRFFCPFCKRWQQYIVTKMTPSCFMYTLSFLLFEEDRCYSDGSVITNFSFYSSGFSSAKNGSKLGKKLKDYALCTQFLSVTKFG